MKKPKRLTERQAFDAYFKRNERWGIQDIGAEMYDGEIKEAMFQSFRAGIRYARGRGSK